MFHRFNSFTGRLVVTEKIISKFPIQPVPLNRADAPAIVYADTHGKLLSVSETQAKPLIQKHHAHGKAGVKYGEVPESIKRKQELFQKPNGLPVHLKGGPMDRALYMLTMGLCGVSLVISAKLIYDLGFAKKNE